MTKQITMSLTEYNRNNIKVMTDLTRIYARLEQLRVIKAYAVRNNKDNLALFCYKQIRLIKRINISLES